MCHKNIIYFNIEPTSKYKRYIPQRYDAHKLRDS